LTVDIHSVFTLAATELSRASLQTQSGSSKAKTTSTDEANNNSNNEK